MRSSSRLSSLLFIVVLTLLAGCSRKDPEDVKVTLADGKLVIVNNSGADIYHHTSDAIGSAWIPASLPNIRIADGVSRVFGIDDRLFRENGIRVNWWHRGSKYPDSDIYGADRVRKVLFDAAAVNAVLPKLPDPAIEQAAAASLATVCRDRVVLAAWTDRRARGAEPSETPPDTAAEGIPSGCQDMVRDCTAAKDCASRLTAERKSLDDLRAGTGFAPTDYLNKPRTVAPGIVNQGVAVDTAANPAAAPAVPLARPGATTTTSAASPVVLELANVCRERTLLDAWDKATSRNAGSNTAPPDFSLAAVPWSCRDLVRDCEPQKSCAAVLAEQKAVLQEVRMRVRR